MMSAFKAFPNLVSLEIRRIGYYRPVHGEKFTWTDLVQQALEHLSLQELRLNIVPDGICFVQQSSRLHKLTITDPTEQSIDILVSMSLVTSRNLIQSLEELRFINVSLLMSRCIPYFQIDQSQSRRCFKFQWKPKSLQSLIPQLQNVKCLNLGGASPDADELPLLSNLPNLKELTIHHSNSVSHFLSLHYQT
jgi:hypothetical protein